MNNIQAYMRVHDIHNIAIKINSKNDFKNTLRFLKTNGVTWGNTGVINVESDSEYYHHSNNCISIYSEGAYISRLFGAYCANFTSLDEFKSELGLADSCQNIDISDLLY